MSNIDKRELREAAEKATPGPWEMEQENIWFTDEDGYTKHLAYVQQGDDVDDKQDHYNTAYIAAANPETVMALLDELEAAEKRIAEFPGQKRLIGWRMADYTDETADPALAKNWATAVDVLPIFEGDVNTKLSAAAAGKGE